MATHYIARGEPIAVSATTTPTVTYVIAGGTASYAVDNITGGNPVKVAIFATGTTPVGNIIVQSGQTKVIAPSNPPLYSGSNLTILTTTTASTSTVYLTPLVTDLS